MTRRQQVLDQIRLRRIGVPPAPAEPLDAHWQRAVDDLVALYFSAAAKDEAHTPESIRADILRALPDAKRLLDLSAEVIRAAGVEISHEEDCRCHHYALIRASSGGSIAITIAGEKALDEFLDSRKKAGIQ